MRRVAIIGAGIAGLTTAHGLRRAGYEVTLFSDRTADQWLTGRPTGTAARFAPALAYERELGLDYWEADASKFRGANMIVGLRPGNQLASMIGRQPKPALAIDVRLQSHRWMHELEARGGRIVIEAVTLERLDAIAAEHELTIVAAGKGELGALFERDEARSGYREPQRNVAMVVVKGPALERDGMPLLGVKFNILDGIGEAVWIPYFHRDVGPCWNLIFEAKAGGPMDVFLGVKTSAEALAAARRTIETLVPRDAAWARDMEIADELGWLAGAITPTVRSPVGRLPSGRLVTCIGDTAMHFDPIAAQGANNCVKMAKHMVTQVVAREDRPFDAAWMTETFERFWVELGQPAYTLTNLLLAPMTPAGRLTLLAANGSGGVGNDGRQALADRFASGFADPSLIAHFTDMAAAKQLIAETTGRGWLRPTASGVLRAARGQLRQAVGRSSGYPGPR
jgi:hypothetical protein